MVVLPGADDEAPATLWWISQHRSQQRRPGSRRRQPWGIAVGPAVRVAVGRPGGSHPEADEEAEEDAEAVTAPRR